MDPNNSVIKKLQCIIKSEKAGPKLKVKVSQNAVFLL